MIRMRVFTLLLISAQSSYLTSFTIARELCDYMYELAFIFSLPSKKQKGNKEEEEAFYSIYIVNECKRERNAIEFYLVRKYSIQEVDYKLSLPSMKKFSSVDSCSSSSSSQIEVYLACLKERNKRRLYSVLIAF